MSSLPSRTRSLCKRVDPATKQNAKPATKPDSKPDNDTQGDGVHRNSRSPSRLPIRPTKRSTSRPSSRSASSTLSNASLRAPSQRVSAAPAPATDSLQRASSNHRPNVPATAEVAKKDRSRPPITNKLRHFRNTSASSVAAITKAPVYGRPRSSSTLSNTSTSLRLPTRGSTDENNVQSSGCDTQARRPAFSTLQQHFSPAKSLAPKPHPAAFLAPPSPSKLPANIALSAETAKLQNELLQLHLLHRDAAQVDNQWRASAKTKLGSHFQSVVETYNALLEHEAREISKLNAYALRTWQDVGVPGSGLEEKIQILDEIVTGVWSLSEPGGRYTKIVRRFEGWVQRSEHIISLRTHNAGSEDYELEFLEEFDSTWKDDCLLICRKLEAWRDNLRDIGVPDGNSHVGVVVDGIQRLVRNMLMELEVMSQIEEGAMRQERDWIQTMNEDVSEGEKERPVAGAIWRAR